MFTVSFMKGNTKTESSDFESRNRMFMQRISPPPPPVRESNHGTRTATVPRRGNVIPYSPGKSLMQRRNIEPLSPISLNVREGLVRNDRRDNWATPTKAATSYTGNYNYNPTPTTVATKAAIAKIQNGKCMKTNSGMCGAQRKTTLLEKENGVSMNTPPKALETNMTKFSPGMRKIISKYGYQKNQGYKIMEGDIAGSAIPSTGNMKSQVNEKPKRETYQEPLNGKPRNHPNLQKQAISNKPPPAFFVASNNDNTQSTTAQTQPHDRLLRGKELATLAAKRRNSKNYLGANTIGTSKSMELESDYDRSFVDTSMIAPSKSTEAYDEEKHGMQINTVCARSPSLLFDRKRRAQLIASHKQRRASSATRSGTVGEGKMATTMKSVENNATLPPKAERGRSTTRRALDASSTRVEQVGGSNHHLKTESTIPPTRSKSVSSTVRLRMQMQNDAKRANAATRKTPLLPPSRSRNYMEPKGSSSVQSDWSTASRDDRRRSMSMPRDLTQVCSDLTDDASYGLDVNQSCISMSYEQRAAQQRKRQKARSMMARRRKFIVHQVDSDTA